MTHPEFEVKISPEMENQLKEDHNQAAVLGYLFEYATAVATGKMKILSSSRDYIANKRMIMTISFEVIDEETA